VNLTQPALRTQPSGSGREQGFDYDRQVIVGTKTDLQKLLGSDYAGARSSRSTCMAR
jgi:hypothetical protein